MGRHQLITRNARLVMSSAHLMGILTRSICLLLRDHSLLLLHHQLSGQSLGLFGLVLQLTQGASPGKRARHEFVESLRRLKHVPFGIEIRRGFLRS